MAQEAQAGVFGARPESLRKKGESSFGRVVRYVSIRLVTLFITVVIGVYLTILIANMGGYVDQIKKGEIREAVQMRVLTDQADRKSVV